MKTIIKHPVRSYFLIAAQVMTMFFLTACTKSNDTMDNGNQNPPPPTKGDNEVYIIDRAFNPVSLTVSAGTIVKWTNKDGVAHTVTSTTGLFDSGTIPNGGTYTFTFATPGTYTYYCVIHPDMAGVVIVQ